jgi:hypothetical protein
MPPLINAFAAPQLVGCLMNFTLLGVLCLQTYIYYITFPNDTKYVKALVYFSFVFEVAQSCLNAVDVYDWFINGFGNLSEFTMPGLSPIYTPIMVSVLALMVQYFFCYRIYVIRKSAWLWCCFIGLISTMQAIGGLIGGSLALMQESFAERFKETEVVYIWLVGSVTADTLIAITMSIFLLKLNTGHFHHTNRAATKIITLTFGTNAVTACTALVGLILFSVSKNTGYFVTPTVILGKLYANTLLVSLNNRAYMNKTKQSYVSYETSGSQSFNTINAGSVTTKSSNTPISAEFNLKSADAFKLQHIPTISIDQNLSQASDEVQREHSQV